jgi:hypothetical protein
MSEFAARIRRVRLKMGGADVHILERKGVNPDGEDWRGTILGHAKSIAALATDDAPLAGFLVIGFFGDGATSAGFRMDQAKCAVPKAMWPAWAAEIVRRDMITEGEARNVFDDMFQWVDG